MIGALGGTLRDCRNLSSPSPPPSSAVSGGIDLWRDTNPPLSTTGALRTDEMHCELLNFAKGAAEMEFSLPSHLVILLPDGMSGGCEWRNGERAGKSSSMRPNTILFNPARDYLWLRKRTSQASCRLLLVTIAPEAMSRLSADDLDTASVRFLQRIGVDDENIRRTLLTLLEEIESPGWNGKLYVEALLTLLLSQLVRCASNLSVPRRTPYRKGGLPSWRLKQALQLIEGDLCQAPSLAELARHLRLHPTSLCRAFKQSTGLSPHQYLLSHRINCAKGMMRDPSITLTEIALDCGFTNSSQFSVTFKRIVGISPREYRRSL
jgi:AraC-like DNA-binding protein